MGNLLSNAHKFTPAQKHIRLAVVLTGTNELAISVSDEGLGIHPADLEVILQPFERDSRIAHLVPGTGLGLPISKKIVELHQGRLEIYTDLDRGSEFKIILPLVPKTDSPSLCSILNISSVSN